jgi:predicted nucleic acid-binding protein
MSNSADKSKDKPSIYIDTGVARDVTERRVGGDASIELLGHIRSKGWSCKMSVFGLMELVNIEQESIFVNKRYFIEKRTLDEIISARRNRNLTKEELERSFKYIEKFRRDYPFVKYVNLSDAGWSLAIVVASDCNLHAADVIHLVSAWQEDCDLIVTDDTFFISEAKKYLQNEGIWNRLKICTPEQCYTVLAEMGFTNL